MTSLLIDLLVSTKILQYKLFFSPTKYMTRSTHRRRTADIDGKKSRRRHRFKLISAARFYGVSGVFSTAPPPVFRMFFQRFGCSFSIIYELIFLKWKCYDFMFSTFFAHKFSPHIKFKYIFNIISFWYLSHK